MGEREMGERAMGWPPTKPPRSPSPVGATLVVARSPLRELLNGSARGLASYNGSINHL